MFRERDDRYLGIKKIDINVSGQMRLPQHTLSFFDRIDSEGYYAMFAEEMRHMGLRTIKVAERTANEHDHAVEINATIRRQGYNLIDWCKASDSGEYLVLTEQILIVQNMKDKFKYGILANNNQVAEGKFLFDRICLLPGFDYSDFPFALLNARDVVDVRTGDLVAQTGALLNYAPVCHLQGTDSLLTQLDGLTRLMKLDTRSDRLTD